MNQILAIAELGHAAGGGILRLPPGVDVPLSPRIRRLIDTPPMRRLSQVSQLGLVQLVYPGATHTRFEHSLGVFRTAIDFLRRLAHDPRFVEVVTPQQAECFLAASLLHDVGHWPYCHPIEDLRLANVERHESLARQHVLEGTVAELLANDWRLDPADVADAIAGRTTSPGEQITASMLSGPIDVDKIDYLARDSHHAGVPYGKHFDASRLMSSLCLNEQGNAVAVTDKGRTAAELMVFARYVMFSEVYWHHAVRAATAMLQRIVYALAHQLDWTLLYQATEAEFPHLIDECVRQSTSDHAGLAGLADGLFGTQRQLYKRLAQYSLAESPEIYQRVARRPYEWLVLLAERLAEALGSRIGVKIAPYEILVDAPPQKLEVQCDIEVFMPRTSQYRPLADVSPVVETLAQRQFDDYVKRVRIYCHPRLKAPLAGVPIDQIATDALATI